jgi:protein-tyrosine phosphatase
MQQKQFADLHSHFLPDLDDGAASVSDTMEMLQMAQDLNIRRLVATPHTTDQFREEIAFAIQTRFKEIAGLIREKDLQLDIYLAAELFYNESINVWLAQKWTTINGNGKYFLFELPMFRKPEGVGDFIFRCRLKGLTPVMAHPERYIYLRDDPDTLLTWYHQGCLMQLNAGSLVGHFGSEVSNFSRKLLAMKFYQIVASDAHNTNSRSYGALTAARDTAAELLAGDELDRIFYKNPLGLIRGDSIVQSVLDEDRLSGWWPGLIDSIRRLRRKIMR